MIPIEFAARTIFIAEIAIPVVIFGVRPVTQIISSKGLRSINPGYRAAVSKFKAANTNKKDAKKDWKAAKKDESTDKDDIKSLKDKWKTKKSRAKRLKKLRKKAAPKSRAAARTIGITASFAVAAATLSGITTQVGFDEETGITANIIHTQRNQWFSLGHFGLGSTSTNTIMTASYSAENGFSGENEIRDYKHYHEMVSSFAHTIGAGSLLYVAFIGAFGGFKRGRSKTFGSTANRSLRVLSYTLPPLAYLSASGFQLHPEVTDHKNTTRIAINFDYDEERAFMQFGKLNDIFTVNGTYNDFTVGYVRIYYTPSTTSDDLIEWFGESFELDGRIHPKVVKAFNRADEENTNQLTEKLKGIIPADFGKDTVVEWVQQQITWPTSPSPE